VAPQRDYSTPTKSLFLAGGISNCPDWQSELIALLSDYNNLTIFNPRRPNYPMDNPNEAYKQIKWEYDQLKTADMIVVWFSKGSINPIVLYELGIWVNARPEVPAFIGIDPGYERAEDVLIQTKLARQEITVVDSLDKLATQIKISVN
jgi:hypothetical protein